VDDVRMLLAGMGLALDPPRSTHRLRLGLPRLTYWEGLAPGVEEIVRKAVDVLAGVCAGVSEIRLPPLPMDPNLHVLPRDYGTIILTEAFTYHEQRMKEHPEMFHAVTRANLEQGSRIKASDYIRARLEMDRARAQSSQSFRDVDLLVMPASPRPACPLGTPPDLIYLRNLAPWNFYGLPAVSVPCGFTRDGLPIGLQIVGQANADAVVLAAAEAYEEEAGLLARRPPDV
jgi:aspartyl-tRNA(Asn)/glutamyl-tRNA(Gln) amidotransferase subunit A